MIFSCFFSLLDFHVFQVFIAHILDPIDKYVDRNLYMKNETKKLIEGGIISLKMDIYIHIYIYKRYIAARLEQL